MRNNISDSWINEDVKNFFSAILKIRNEEECKNFLRDLMTVTEIKTFSSRWKAARMLEKGTTYKEIEKRTGMSSTTIARISRWLEYGEGGYKLILKRMKRN